MINENACQDLNGICRRMHDIHSSCDDTFKKLPEVGNLCQKEKLTNNWSSELKNVCNELILAEKQSRCTKETTKLIMNFVNDLSKEDNITCAQLQKKYDDYYSTQLANIGPGDNVLKYLCGIDNITCGPEVGSGIVGDTSTFVQQDDSEDDEARILHENTNLVDPYSKLAIVNPVINLKCKHIYEKDTIVQFVERNERRKKKTRCFHIGCENMLSTADFIDYKV